MNQEKDHKVVVDSKDQYWVTCPEAPGLPPLAINPMYCPGCGKHLEKGEDNK